MKRTVLIVCGIFLLGSFLCTAKSFAYQKYEKTPSISIETQLSVFKKSTILETETVTLLHELHELHELRDFLKNKEDVTLLHEIIIYEKEQNKD
jgi:hypothetical protein